MADDLAEDPEDNNKESGNEIQEEHTEKHKYGKRKSEEERDTDESEEEKAAESNSSDINSVSPSPGILYSDEYEGDDGYFATHTSLLDLDLINSGKDDVEQTGDLEHTGSLKTDFNSERSDEGEEENEAKDSPGMTPARSVDVQGLSSESIFDNFPLEPKEKTWSEIKFETEHRELIEEEMKKFLKRRALKEEKVVERRKPLEKTEATLTDMDISGLYPPPKAIKSEPSFAFDEDEEVERFIARPQEADADIIKSLMDSIRENSKSDPESMLSKEISADMNEVQRAIEEIVRLSKRGQITNISNLINELLPNLKANQRNIVIQVLYEKLSRYQKIAEVKEEEEGTNDNEDDERQKGKKGVKKEITKAEVIEKEAAPIKGAEMSNQLEKPQRVYVESKEKKPEAEVVEKGPILPRTEEEFKKTIEQTKIKAIPEEEIYENIDWDLFLTESERKIGGDPWLKEEMEKYIEGRKSELLKEIKAEKEKLEQEERYISCDPQFIIKNANLNVTMKFILNSGEIYTCAYRYFMTFREIKEDLSAIFRVPPDVLIIYRENVEVKDEESAYDLTPKIEPFECANFRLLTVDNDKWQLRSSNVDLPVPDIITCTVETGCDYKGIPEYKEVVVEIEERKIKKPFVGGYRNIATGIEYHHAFSQSAPREPSLPCSRRVTTDTQTTEFRSKCVDTTCDKSTQMCRSDYYITTESDKILTPQPYVDYDTWLQRRDLEGKITLIQRHVRAMIIRKFIQRMSKEYQARKLWEEEQERQRVVEREMRVKKGIINMVYPNTKADFEALYAMVERWRKAQIEKIAKIKTEAPRKAELCAVLEKEIKLLEAIEVHRIAVAKEKRKKKELNFLAQVSKPATWTGYRGITISMDTLKTQRARELRELYLALSKDDINYQDRIELIISLKYALRVNCTRLTDELTRLLDRECEMLIRGVHPKKLEYLRRRIDHLFLKYFKDPDFNPEVAKYDPDYNREPLKRNVMFCKMCHQMKMYKEFGVTGRDTNSNVCLSCKTTFNIAVTRIDLNPYRHILKCVRKDEQKRNCYSSCAFILQDEDMRFIVDNIWHGRSAISEYDNLMDLRMPRWNKEKDWTPWNCILLTEAEARAHLRIEPRANYERQLIGEVTTKHELAKRYFQQMFSTEERMRDCGKWANIVDTKMHFPPPAVADIWDLTESECANLKEKGRIYETRQK